VGWTAFFAWRATVRIGGEANEDLVGLIDDVIVGDDVAARVDDEAGAEGFALATEAAVVVTVATLAAEEAVEKVLHVAGLLLVVIVAALRSALTATVFLDGGLLGQGVGGDVDHGGTDLFDDLRKTIRKSDGRRDNERLCVG